MAFVGTGIASTIPYILDKVDEFDLNCEIKHF